MLPDTSPVWHGPAAAGVGAARDAAHEPWALAALCRELGSHSHHLEPDLPVRAQCAHSSSKLISSPPLSGQEEVERLI